MSSYDVIVIGAGPAGSCSSALLAEKGRKVLVLEREKFPRYHIGESLLPFTHEPLKRLGLLDKMNEAGFVKKFSVQFVGRSGKASLPFYFGSRYPEHIAQTWQVLRSEFDQLLMNNARAKGAEIREEMNVREFIQDGARIVGVKAVDKQGKVHEFHAPITLDCSGRESLAASRKDWRVKDPYLNKVAVWTYIKGANRDAGIDEGATTVAYVHEKGWFWYIPQHNDIISVGVVAEGKYLYRNGTRDSKTIFHQEVEENQWIKDHIAPGHSMGTYYTTGEFSWRSKFSAMDGLVLCGDAFGFLDPVFSSGVMLALKSGTLAADTIEQCFKANDFSASRFVDYGNYMKQGIENMRKLVYAFYDLNFSFRKLTEKYPEAHGQITDCLSGDVNKDFTWLYERCAEMAKIPEDLPCGDAMVLSAGAAGE